MIGRTDYLAAIDERLKQTPVVALLGQRQTGKTTLARMYAQAKRGVFIDLETLGGLNWLEEPAAALDLLRGVVVINDVQRKPELFQLLRELTDRNPLPARFLILGKGLPRMLDKVSETLAGRVSFLEVAGFHLGDVGGDNFRQLWWRGGLPLAYTAENDRICALWQEDYMNTVLERELWNLDMDIPASRVRQLWALIVECHGQKYNGAEVARTLGSYRAKVLSDLELLKQLGLVRQLPAWYGHVPKREVRLPKYYVHDSGVLHYEMKLDGFAALEAHPKLEDSWKSFVMEQVLSVTGDQDAYYWSTHNGMELDLLVFWQGKRVGFEFPYSDAPTLSIFKERVMQLLKLDQLFLVHPGGQSLKLIDKVERVSIRHLPERLKSFSAGGGTA